MAVNSSDNVKPFTITVPQEALDDLHLRLSLTRWTDEVPGAGWSYGANLAYMKELVAYWQDSFDWRQRERELNALPHFRATIDGINIHFIGSRRKALRFRGRDTSRAAVGRKTCLFGTFALYCVQFVAHETFE